MKRIAYCSDLHGNEDRYRQFFSIEADYHIIGGDLFPRKGYYKRLIDNQRHFMESFLKPLLKEYKDSTKPLLMIGNDDIEPLEKILLSWQEADLCQYLHAAKIQIEAFEVIGFKYIPPTPFSLKNIERRDSRGRTHRQIGGGIVFQPDGTAQKVDFDDYLSQQPSIMKLLEQLPPPSDYSKAIYVMHSPPYNSGIDVTVANEPVGSLDIRRFILKFQPALVLCGHVHEQAGTVYLGTTPCINPGQLHHFAYCLFELDQTNLRFLHIPKVIAK
ncbi:MAG: metallophosphoesterase family protein [Candidatus Helarchaeota archaeon]